MTRPDAMAHPVSQSSWRNLPNLLTLLRLLLVVPFAVALFWEDGTSVAARVVATVVFVVASATDFVDGYLARSRNLVTNFGKIADPIADKLLTGTALIGLSILGQLSWWVTWIILGREIIVTVLRFWVIKDGVIPASRGGKVKTVAQIIAIILYLLPLTGFGVDIAHAMMGLAVLLTVVTGIDYAARAAGLHRRAVRAGASGVRSGGANG